jgi:hypothetical protein
MEEPTAVNPRWRKSSYSDNGGTACVEAGHVPGAVLIRDTTQHGRGPVLRVTPADWDCFTARVRANAAHQLAAPATQRQAPARPTRRSGA